MVVSLALFFWLIKRFPPPHLPRTLVCVSVFLEGARTLVNIFVLCDSTNALFYAHTGICLPWAIDLD